MTRAKQAGTTAPEISRMAPDDYPYFQFVERWNGLLSECCSFAADRVRANVEAQTRILHCTNPGDVQVELLRYAHRMVSEYQEEAARISRVFETTSAFTAPNAVKASEGKSSTAV
ncbi:hypothetical protein [Roseivivax sp. CAU 1761]